MVEQAWLTGKPGRHYWWVAPNYRQAKIAFNRIKLGMTRGSFTKNDSDLTLTLLNGAILEFRSADNPDGLYGEDVYAAVIDEASRCPEASWYAVRSTLTQTRAPLRIIGNVKGRRNWAYQLARRAEAGEPDMHYAKLTAYDAVAGGVMDAAEVEDAKRTLPEQVFNELYLAIPADDGGNPFGLKAIRELISPLSSAPPVAWGWDLAKSVDWTVGIALDIDGAACQFERWQGPWQETIRRILAATGTTPALVDSTGVGDPILEALQMERPGTFEGFKFTSASKQQLMEGLAVAIQQSTIRYPPGPVVSELETFEYEYTRTGVRYAAPEGMHDDCVMALGLAVHHWTSGHWDRLPYGWVRQAPQLRAPATEAEQSLSDEERIRLRLQAYYASEPSTD